MLRYGPVKFSLFAATLTNAEDGRCGAAGGAWRVARRGGAAARGRHPH